MNTFTHTITRLILATCALVLSAQSLAALNPNPITKKFYVGSDGSINTRWVEKITGTFSVAIPGESRVRATCIQGKETIETENGNDVYVQSNSFCTTKYLRGVTPNQEADAERATPGTVVNLTHSSRFRAPEGESLGTSGAGILRNYTLCIDNDCGNISMRSTDTLEAPEGTSITHTLQASDPFATFQILGNAGLFSLSGDKNATLTFNGTTTDFESSTKSYTVKIKASTGSAASENVEQEITL
ncbi:MAG: hypothetical protein FE834_09635, partial [Gammaproteobacteria bacterium]|nr:hypothetical protein [Gammaproteobacteria bacterium]